MIRWVALTLCATVTGCSTTNETTNVTEVVVVDGGRLGEVTAEAGGDATVGGGGRDAALPSFDSAVGPGDDGAFEPDGAPICPALGLDGMEASTNCESVTDLTTSDGAVAFPCPACEPNAYLCHGGDYPVGAAFAEAGAVLETSGSGVAAKAWVCSAALVCTEQDPESAGCDGGHAYACPNLPDGGFPMVGCWTPVPPILGDDVCCP